jgi:GTP-binding protein
MSAMSLPTVAIVGRPNVGKSSLLNRLVGHRISIVDPTPGVTRDRVSAPCALGEGYVELVDTGGMGIEDVDQLTEHVENQIAYGMAEADLIVFLVDAREGLTPLDRHAAERLRRLDVPVLLAANKVDEVELPSEAAELNALGFGDPIHISAHHGIGIDALTEAISKRLGKAPAERVEPAVMKLAVIGKRNTGKSTFINALAGEERVIVSETPGTTRDSVDVTIELDGRRLMLIDTAGVRKRRKITGDVEFYSYRRALRSIRRADVVALMIDASVPVSKVDKDLARQVAEEFKPVILVVNKWDLARDVAAGEDYAEYLGKVFPELSFAPISLTSATTGLNVADTIRLAGQLFAQARHRVGTGELNRVIEEIVRLRGPSHKAGTRPPKVLYVSQIATAPPTIVCFVNDVRSFDRNYQRFLINQFREHLPYSEVPIRLVFRSTREERYRKGAPGKEE